MPGATPVLGVNRLALHLTAVAVLVVLAGCAGTPGLGPATTTEQTDRETDCPTAEDYEPRSLPDRPDTFTNESVAEFVAAYEEAIVWNENVGAHHKLSVSGAAEILNRTESGFVVEVRGGFSRHGGCDDGAGHSIGEGGFAGLYFVNESVVIRATPNPDEPVAPRTDGEVVERWSTDSNESTESNGSRGAGRSAKPLHAHSSRWSSRVSAASVEEPGPRAVTRSPSTVTLVSASSSASQFAPAATTSSSTQ